MIDFDAALAGFAALDEQALVRPWRWRESTLNVREALAARSRAAGAPIELVVYEGAEHNFDDPGPGKQSRDANRRATDDARVRAARFFDANLKRRPD